MQIKKNLIYISTNLSPIHFVFPISKYLLSPSAVQRVLLHVKINPNYGYQFSYFWTKRRGKCFVGKNKFPPSSKD